MEWSVGQDVTILIKDVPYKLETVIKVTKTRVVLSKKQSFRVKDGHAIRNRTVSHLTMIAPTTQEHLDTMVRNQLLKQLKHTLWSDYTTGTLQSICSLIEKDEN